MSRSGQVAGLVAVVALLAAGCGDGGDGGAGADDTVQVEPAPDPGTDADGDDPTQGPGEEDDVADDDPAALAVADAAERTGVAQGEITVVTNESVTWPDGSLGCPQPDQFYTQALVEGYRIVVEADGEQLHYHGQAGGPPTYCANPSDPAQGGSDTGVVDQ